MKYLFGLLLFLTTSISVSADQERQLFDQAKYSEALAALEAKGIHSVSDYYNGGCIYYKLGRLSEALAYFEKANAMAPRNDDVSYNLKLTKSALKASGQLQKDSSFWTGYIIPITDFIPDFIVHIWFGLFAFFFALQLHKLFRGTHYSVFSTPVLFALFLFLTATTAEVLWTVAANIPLATIKTSSIVARSGPSDSFTELFHLSAGTKVELTTERREGWAQIRFSLGNVGWVMEKDLINL